MDTNTTSSTTAQVLERFNRAFLEHDPSLNMMTVHDRLIVEGRGYTKGRP